MLKKDYWSWDVLTTTETLPTFLFWKAAGGNTKHGTGHFLPVLIDKETEPEEVVFTCFVQHPPYGFLYQRVRTFHQGESKAECIFDIAVMYKRVCRHHSDTVVPRRIALG